MSPRCPQCQVRGSSAPSVFHVRVRVLSNHVGLIGNTQMLSPWASGRAGEGSSGAGEANVVEVFLGHFPRPTRSAWVEVELVEGGAVRVLPGEIYRRNQGNWKTRELKRAGEAQSLLSSYGAEDVRAEAAMG